MVRSTSFDQYGAMTAEWSFDLDKASPDDRNFNFSRLLHRMALMR